MSDLSRGAERVLAVDGPAWSEPAWGPDGYGTKAPFELARRALGSRVEDRDIELDEIGPETVGRVDVVHREPRAYRFARAAYRRLRGPRFRAQQGRVAVHAHRAENK